MAPLPRASTGAFIPPSHTQVLVFRRQENLSPERHVEFSRCFGDLYCHVIGASHDAVRVGICSYVHSAGCSGMRGT